MKIAGSADPSQLVKLKDNDWLQKQRVAGRVVAATLKMLRARVEQKTTASMLELNQEAEDYITSQNCTATFKNYKGFPSGVCISVNKQLVHGIPGDYKLVDGDVVSFDLGATYEGTIADSALTCIYGIPKSDRHVKLIKTTEECLETAIQNIAVGKQLGVIGHTIFKHARANDFSVVVNYGGHGIDFNHPHANPFVANRAELNEGIIIQPGLTIAIEPMLVIGNPHTKTLSDGWTVVTDDIGCHFEHSVFVHENHVEVLTRIE